MSYLQCQFQFIFKLYVPYMLTYIHNLAYGNYVNISNLIPNQNQSLHTVYLNSKARQIELETKYEMLDPM